MVATVEDLCMDDPEEDAGQERSCRSQSRTLRTTIGTKNASVPVVEAGALVQSFKQGEKGMESVPREGVYIEEGKIKGLFS